MYTTLAKVEQEYDSNHAEPLKLSSHYLISRLWLDRAFESVESDSMSVNVSLGANYEDSRTMVNLYGVMPDAAWTGQRNFNQQPAAGRIEEYVRTIITQARYSRSIAKTEKEKTAATVLAKKQITKLLREVTGPWPETFEYRGQTLTPSEFTAKYYKSLSKPVIELAVEHNPSFSPVRWEPRDGLTRYQAGIDYVEDVARQAIDQGQAVYLTYEHRNEYMHGAQGILSQNAVNGPAIGKPLSRTIRKMFGQANAGHAVLVVGYELDPKTGRVKKWKVKNTWGPAAGDKGFYHMYADYFREFASSIGFASDPAIKLPETGRPLRY